MKTEERLLYQKNKLGNLLILLSIALNVVYSIFILNNMTVDFKLGIFVMITILLLLIGFLTGVKVQAYSKQWSIVAVILGLFQCTRILFTESTLEGNMLLLMTVVLITSGLVCILGGIVSYNVSSKRAAYIKEHSITDDVLNH